MHYKLLVAPAAVRSEGDFIAGPLLLLLLMYVLWLAFVLLYCTSFVDLLCFFLSCVCYAFVRVCLYVPLVTCLG